VKAESNYVLDSFALLAFLRGEPSARRVRQVLSLGKRGKARIWMSAINLGEVAYITERERGLEGAHKTLALVEQLSVTVVDPDRRMTLAAAHIKARYGIAYADTFAIALARSKNAAVLTGDPEFKKVAGHVRSNWLS
jgi:ribonuclease VapC